MSFNPLSAKFDLKSHHRNQEDIVGRVARVLNDLIGWDLGQYGEAVFFVQGAFRNAESDLKSFE